MEANISGNTITNCSAQRIGTFFSGANVYGGGISVAVGAYSHSSSGSTSSSSSVLGDTTVSNTSYIISSNTLTSCSATFSARLGYFSSDGANGYGGGISVGVGAYSYSREAGTYSWDITSSSNVSGSTTVINTSYIISSNTLTNCSATSSVISNDGYSSSYGANVYGGGISVAVGAYSYSRGFRSDD
jgi:hypothetical protein